MNQKSFLLTLFLFSLFLIGCSDEEQVFAPEISGIEESYTILDNQSIKLSPVISSEHETAYFWLIDGVEVADAPEYVFGGKGAGEYKLVFRAVNKGGVTQKEFVVNVYASSNTFNAEVYSILQLELPGFVGEGDNVVLEVTESDSDLYRLTQNEKGDMLFASVEAGRYSVKLTSGDFVTEYTIIVSEREKEISGYTANVFDYLPAPGQFVNKLPAYKEGDTYEDMVAKAANAITGSKGSFITLGGWGGYVVVGFDHTIVNIEGKRDFRIHGNSFLGSAEPGVIMVAYDKNKNGKPDEDEWYEIAGSGNFTAEKESWYEDALAAGGDLKTYRDYEMTFYRPEVEDNNVTDTYIRWTNNKGGEGHKVKNSFHKQPYFPQWIKEDEITYKGIKLADNGWDRSGSGTYFFLEYYSYGYVDNYPNNDKRAAIDIDWAIDRDGKPANLPGIDFVKVINGVDKENGWLGEASTEVGKGEDLHALGIDINSVIE